MRDFKKWQILRLGHLGLLETKTSPEPTKQEKTNIQTNSNNSTPPHTLIAILQRSHMGRFSGHGRDNLQKKIIA